jgi:hypothetical protein
MALEREWENYEAKLPELKEHEGKYALIKADRFVDAYGTYEDALKQGYAVFKLEPFLVTRIHSFERVRFISRFVDPSIANV